MLRTYAHAEIIASLFDTDAYFCTVQSLNSELANLLSQSHTQVKCTGVADETQNILFRLHLGFFGVM